MEDYTYIGKPPASIFPVIGSCQRQVNGKTTCNSIIHQNHDYVHFPPVSLFEVVAMFRDQPSQTPIFEACPFKRSNILNSFFNSILRLFINLLDPLHRCHFWHFTFNCINCIQFIIFSFLIFGLHNFHAFSHIAFRHQHEAIVQHPRLLQGRLRLISGGVTTGLRLLLGFGALRVGLLYAAKVLEAPLLGAKGCQGQAPVNAWRVYISF